MVMWNITWINLPEFQEEENYISIDVQFFVDCPKLMNIFINTNLFRVNLLSTVILRLICWNTGKYIQCILHINNYWFEYLY